ncbi:LOW QUALITY PROTEIN: fizzy-related protein homolog [Convolutriloba macropyga]|uniref:LOW QUALITY PROTEIN: fizzy-related protein homolog n=1 Tax=Convolutriloba macropyga TaxID=536237 RepID=UPI003F526D62
MDLDFQDRLIQQQFGGSSVGSSESPIKCVSPYKLASPSKEKIADRFIPLRTNARWALNFGSPNDKNKPSAPPPKKSKDLFPDSTKDHYAYSCLLSNELLGHEISDVKSQDLPQSEKRALVPVKPNQNQNLLQYNTTARVPGSENLDPTAPDYSLSPINKASQTLLMSPRKAVRKICKQPFKVLDAPQLQDDFYLNLVDWSSQNFLAVGLGSCTYLWDATSSNVTKLCDLASEEDAVTSVSWADRGTRIAIGTRRALVQIWDVSTQKRICELSGHAARVASLAWNGDLISSGSRDRSILQRDTRSPRVVADRKLNGHKQEVCGLKWSPDKQLLASGGNDNKLFVWDCRSNTYMQQYTDHIAAVKAIAWSPHQHGLLASGGGTADRCIRFWNTLTQQPLSSIDTGSQVCNLSWAKYTSELVSTHGYSQNQILIWKYPSMQQVVKLTGHTFRVLYLAVSPDGESIVTGAGDETLRFWNVFSKSRAENDSHSVLNLFTQIR